MTDDDTIAAIATPPGFGGVGIVRVSGKKAQQVAAALLGACPPVRQAVYKSFVDDNGETIDQGIALFFKGPNSFTGEDVLELQGHGGPVVLDLLLQRIITLGVRAARAGEFSERAFHNNKIDLAQAEAIADLIAAESNKAARAAMHSLQGEFSSLIHRLVEQLIQLRMYVESALDFPEEEIDFLSDAKVIDQLNAINEQLENIRQTARQGRLLREGMTVVIAGKPNAGKSSLLNRLAGQDTAIVTDVPGTTRDVLREHIQIDGLPLHIIDTAGLRESEDRVEQEGVRRAMQEINKADRILFVTDNDFTPDEQNQYRGWGQKNIGVTLIHNKIDLENKAAGIEQNGDETAIHLSAKTGDGIDLLRQHLESVMGFEQQTEGRFIARRRHLDAIGQAQQYMDRAKQQLTRQQAGELLAEELKYAQQALATITGEFTPDDLLGRIFADFCIGK